MPAYIANAAQGIVKPPDVKDVEDLCALLTSCDDVPVSIKTPRNMPGCVGWLMQELSAPEGVKFNLTLREAGFAAISCKDLQKKMLHGVGADSCKGRGENGTLGRCDLDGHAITCSHDEITQVRDCLRGGESCVVVQGQATCALGPCTGENKEGAPPSCSADGARVLQCNHGKLTSVDCGAFGLKCSMEEGKAGCAPPTAACTGTGKHCEGNVSVGCVHDHEVRVDCGASGMTCNSGTSSNPAAVGACIEPPPVVGEKCDPKEAAKCDGAKINYCFAGQKRSYLCRTVGLDKCVKDGSSVHCGM